MDRILGPLPPSTKGLDDVRARYFDDPVGFARDVLLIILWSRQREIAEAVAKNKQVAVRSGHKTGKSTLLAVLAFWWVCTRPNGCVVMSSASGRQVRGILWKEVRRIYRKAGPRIGGRIHKVPALGLQFDDGREVVGFSTNEPEKMAGVSGSELLFLLDEASGIDEEIFEAIEGNRAGDDGDEEPSGGPAAEARIVLTSNPTKTSGTFFEAFHARSEFWVRFRVSSEEAAEVTPRIRGLATKAYVAQKKREWGEKSPLYQVRVKGDFPEQGERAVISLARVTEAVERFNPKREVTPADGRLEIGVDVARYGDDDSVLQPGRGKFAMHAVTVSGFDNVEVAGEVIKMVRSLRCEGERPRVKVDVIGQGAGVADILRHQDEVEIELVEVNVAENATAEGYHRLRDQLWFAMNDWLEDGAIPPTPLLEAELVAPEYSFDAQARQQVTSKDDIKKKIHRSPDRADALGLMVYQWGDDDMSVLPAGRRSRRL